MAFLAPADRVGRERQEVQLLTIVGAGIGGLAFAASCDKLGIPVQIVEQAHQIERVGTGIGLAPNAVKALEPLGILERLRSIAFEPDYHAHREWDSGKMISQFPVKGEMEQKYGAPYLLLHRGDLHRMLAGLVGEQRIRLGHKVRTIVDGDDGVQLHFDDGSTEEVDLVIGADGVHSVARASIRDREDAQFTGRVAYRSVFPSSALGRALVDPMTKWWGPDRHIVIYYVSAGNEIYFTTSVPHEASVAESFSMRTSMEEVRAAFAGFDDEVQDVLDACPQSQKWAIFDRQPLERWSGKRIVLLGDACHPMTPYMQQGAATAMEDGVVLARCLANSSEGGFREAVALYEKARCNRATAIQVEARENRWNRFGPGVPEISHEAVYSYDAWSVPLDDS